MANPLRTLMESIGVNLDNLGRVREQKILDIPRTNPTVVSGQIVTPSMDQNEVDALYNVLADKNVFSKNNIKGINYGRIGSLFDEVDGLNPNDPQSYETMLTNLRTKNAELFDHLRRKKTISISDMVKMVGEKDLGDLMKKFLMLLPGEQLPAEDIVGGLIIMKRLMQEIKYGHKKMSEIPDTPEIKATMPALAEERRLQAKKYKS